MEKGRMRQLASVQKDIDERNRRLSGQAKLNHDKETALQIVNSLIATGNDFLSCQPSDDKEQAKVFREQIGGWKKKVVAELRAVTDQPVFAGTVGVVSGGVNAGGTARGDFEIAIANVKHNG